MESYCGIGVSLEQSSVCVVDATGLIMYEATVASDPDSLIAWFSDLDLPFSRIGLEAGPLSQWLYAGLAKAGFAVELLEIRHVRDAFKAMPIKTDRKDARGIAQLMVDGVAGPIDRLVSTGAPAFFGQIAASTRSASHAHGAQAGAGQAS